MFSVGVTLMSLTTSLGSLLNTHRQVWLQGSVSQDWLTAKADRVLLISWMQRSSSRGSTLSSSTGASVVVVVVVVEGSGVAVTGTLTGSMGPSTGSLVDMVVGVLVINEWALCGCGGDWVTSTCFGDLLAPALSPNWPAGLGDG